MRNKHPTHLGSTRRVRGFTVLELMIVLVVIGIIGAIFSYTLFNSFQSSLVQQGATQLAADLNRAKSLSQRSTTNSSVTISATGASNTYTTQWINASTGGILIQTSTLPNGISVSLPSTNGGSNIVTFSPPFGTQDAVGEVWVVSGASRVPPLYVKVIGVTAKVVISATN